MGAKDAQHNTNRRRFLKRAAMGGAVAGVASTTSALAMTNQDNQPVEKHTASASDSGYQETAHVRRFYDLARG